MEMFKMRIPAAFLQIIAVVCLVTAPGASAVDSFRLINGQAVAGKLSVQKSGMFKHTAEGGKLYRWEFVEPESLPESVRLPLQRFAVQKLQVAQKFYQGDRIEDAAPMFATAYKLRFYLPQAATETEAFTNISYKRQGKVSVDGVWMSYADKQRLAGLEKYHGEWVPEKDAAVSRKFDEALSQARTGKARAASIRQLRGLVDRYPDAQRAPAARAAVDSLTNDLERAVAKAEAAEKAAAAREQAARERETAALREAQRAREEVVIVDDRDRFDSYYYGGRRYHRSYPYTTYGYSYTHPVYVGSSRANGTVINRTPAGTLPPRPEHRYDNHNTRWPLSKPHRVQLNGPSKTVVPKSSSGHFSRPYTPAFSSRHQPRGTYRGSYGHRGNCAPTITLRL
jgi:hypothetical protein